MKEISCKAKRAQVAAAPLVLGKITRVDNISERSIYKSEEVEMWLWYPLHSSVVFIFISTQSSRFYRTHRVYQILAQLQMQIDLNGNRGFGAY